MNSTYGRRSVVDSTVKTSLCQASNWSDVGPCRRCNNIYIV